MENNSTTLISERITQLSEKIQLAQNTVSNRTMLTIFSVVPLIIIFILLNSLLPANVQSAVCLIGALSSIIVPILIYTFVIRRQSNRLAHELASEIRLVSQSENRLPESVLDTLHARFEHSPLFRSVFTEIKGTAPSPAKGVRHNIYLLEIMVLIGLGVFVAFVMDLLGNLFATDLESAVIFLFFVPVIFLAGWLIYLFQLKTMAGYPIGCLIFGLIVLSLVYGAGIIVVILLSLFDLNRLIISKKLYLGDAPVEYFWSPESRKQYAEWKQQKKSIVAEQKIEKLEETKDVGRLIYLLQSGSNDEKKAAAQALGALGDKQAVEPLIAALKHNSLDLSVFAVAPKIPVRAAAALALGKLGDVRAVEPLIAVLQNKGVSPTVSVFMNPVQAAAATALGQLGNPRAMEPLTIAIDYKSLTAPLQKNYEEVKIAAAAALEKLGQK